MVLSLTSTEAADSNIKETFLFFRIEADGKRMEKKKIKLQKLLAAVFTAWTILLGLASPVMAEEARLSLAVSQKIDSANDAQTAANIAVSYVLTAENDAPMPEGTENGKYSFTMVGNDLRKLEIDYNRVGNYSYILERTGIAGADGGSFSGDPRKVRIQNTVYGEDEFQVVTVVYILEADSDVGKKMPEFTFQYAYTAAEATVTPTLTPTATNRPNPTATTRPGPTTRPTAIPTRPPATTTPADGWAGIVDAVKTGDESNPAFYLILMAAAGAVCLICLRKRNGY